MLHLKLSPWLLSAVLVSPLCAYRVKTADFIEPAPVVAEVHASTIVEASDGSLVAAWFGGTKEGNSDVTIWVSRQVDGRWMPAVVVADGCQPEGRQWPCWNPVLHRAADGRLILFIKVGPSPETWWGEVLISRDDGRTWGERAKLPEGMLGPIKNKPVLLADGTLLCPSSIEHDAKRWALRMESTDESLTHWRSTGDISDPQGYGAIQPVVLPHPDGRLQALSRSSVRQLVQNWSTDGGKTWTAPEPTGLFMPNSGVDAVALRDGGFLLVFNPSEKDANPKSWGERRPLIVAHSKNGSDWKELLTLETAPNRHGYAYPAIIQARDGRVHITYTWNRARIKHVVLEKQ